MRERQLGCRPGETVRGDGGGRSNGLAGAGVETDRVAYGANKGVSLSKFSTRD